MTIYSVLLSIALAFIAWSFLDWLYGHKRSKTTIGARSALTWTILVALNLIDYAKGGEIADAILATVFTAFLAVEVIYLVRARRNEAAAEANG